MQLIVPTGLRENQTAPTMTPVSRGKKTPVELFWDGIVTSFQPLVELDGAFTAIY